MQLYPLVSQVYGGLVFFEARHFKALVSFHVANLHKFPLEFDCIMFKTNAPPQMGGKPMVSCVFSFIGSEEKGKVIVDQYRSIGTPFLDMCKKCDYISELQHMLDKLSPPKPWMYMSPRLFNDTILSEETIHDICTVLDKAPDGINFFLENFHGISEEKAYDFNSMGTRGYRYQGVFALMYPTPMDSKQEEIKESNLKWIKEARESLQKHFASAFYHNNMTDDMDAGLKKSNWGKNFERLQALKTKYDPEGVFLPLT